MVKLLSTIILILAIILFPPAALAFVSQNAIPGDSTYPIKRDLENVILKLASVNPVTQAWFSVNVSNRRFEESKALISQGKQADTTLNELVDQTTIAAQEVNQVPDSSQKQKLNEDLNQSISNYIVTLSQQETNTTYIAIPTTQSPPTQTITPTPLSTPNTLLTLQLPTPTPAPSSSNQPGFSITVTSPNPSPPSPTFAPTNPTLSTPSSAPSNTTISSPTPNPSPTGPQDPKQICSNLPKDTSTLSDTIKKLCGLLNSQNSSHSNKTQSIPKSSTSSVNNGGNIEQRTKTSPSGK